MEVEVAIAVNPNVGFGDHVPVLWDSVVSSGMAMTDYDVTRLW